MDVKLSELRFRDYGESQAPTPWERVKIANQVAFDAANDPNIRRLAGEILKGVRNVPRYGSAHIAKWIRKNLVYLQENPGVELLQGPYTTLYAGVVDCDDAAILHTALARAAGLRTFFVGVGEQDNPDSLVHAVVYDMGLNQLYETIDDSNYGGARTKLKFHLPKGYFAVYHSNEPGAKGYYTSMDGSNFQREGSDMACNSCNSFMGTSPGDKGKDAPTAGGQAPSQGGGGWLETLIEQAGGAATAWLTPEDVTNVYVTEEPTAPPVEQSSFPWGLAIAGIGGAGLLIWLIAKE